MFSLPNDHCIHESCGDYDVHALQLVNNMGEWGATIQITHPNPNVPRKLYVLLEIYVSCLLVWFPWGCAVLDWLWRCLEITFPAVKWQSTPKSMSNKFKLRAFSCIKESFKREVLMIESFSVLLQAYSYFSNILTII